MMRLAFFAILVLIPLISSCSTESVSKQETQIAAQPVPSPTIEEEVDPLRKAVRREGSAQEDDTTDNRLKARAAALEYVKSHFPQKSIKGASAVAYTGNLYFVSVDFSLERNTEMVNLIVRMFVTEQGETYWKAEPFTSEIGQLLSGYTFQRYKKLKSEYKTLESLYTELEARKADE